MNNIRLACWLCVFTFILSPLVNAQAIVENVDQEPKEASWIAVPALFYSDYLGLAIGAGAYVDGLRQPQESFLASAYVSESGSRGLWFYSYQTQFLERLFADSSLHWGWRHDIQTFRNGNPNFTNQEAGSHGSSDKNYVISTGEDAFINLDFSYVLPIGDGKQGGIHRYKISKSQLIEDTASGARYFNPNRSGRFFLGAEFFMHRQNFHDQYDQYNDQRSSGLRFSANYDNRNWSSDPSAGSNHQLTISRDPGSFDSTVSWTKVELDLSKYWPLGPSAGAKNRVLAMNFYTADIITWEPDSPPPEFEQVTLGGYDRMRAYPHERFHDKAAIYYGLEHRYTFAINPINLLPLPSFVPDFDLQLASFFELGRVHNEYSFSELNSDMNWSAGLGLRGNHEGSTGRLGFAIGDDVYAFYLGASYPW